MPDLTTPRLLLHPVTLAEADALRAGERIESWTYASGYPMQDTKDGVSFVVRHRVEEFGFYLVVRRDDTLVIGEIGFTGPPRERVVGIGYAIVPAARRQGYATEAIGALSAWALDQPGVDEVTAQTLPDNEASVRALRRAGFSETEPGEKVRAFSRRAG